MQKVNQTSKRAAKSNKEVKTSKEHKAPKPKLSAKMLNNNEHSVSEALELFPIPAFENRILDTTKPLQTHIVLPPLARAIAESIAAKTESCVEFSVASFLVVLSAASANRLRIQPDMDNGLYVITPNLSGIIIAKPGSRKSAPVSVPVNILNRVQQQANKKFELELEQFNHELFKAKSHNKAVENTVKKLNARLVTLSSQSEDIDVHEVEHLKHQIDDLAKSRLSLPKRPSPKIFSVQTLTMKGCIGLAESQISPILVYRDEMTPFLTEMYSSQNADLRRFLIEGMDGKSHYTNVTAFKHTHTSHPPMISLLGTTQPSTIKKLINQIESGKWPDDGYLDRIQLIAYPSDQRVFNPREASLSSDSYADNSLDKFEKLLLNFYVQTNSNTELINVTLNDDAKYLFQSYKNSLTKLQQSEKVPTSIKNKLSKYPDMILSLALVIAVLRQYETDPNSLFTLKTLIGPDLKMAWKLANHYYQHLKKLWGYEPPAKENALKILKNINKLMDKDRCFTTRDITQSNWAGIKNDNAKIKEALGVLVNEGVIKSVKDNKKTGHPSEKWQLIVKIVD
ncbi:DUF3987 domain-containing protein [Shewanella baltica]|uniref:YfjI family protein n=1 Tax=Shewanella baltica TaxID=62322 RepID=UPI00217F0ED6|nr:YfjI family protein [Shewanella baltica]MCS6260726.1 DUF3987 domain-containing protein [Shewanella baltica]